MTEIVRIEKIAATCDDENDALAFQRPMTEAWNHYVNSNQFLTELRGLSRNYPFSAGVLDDAKVQQSLSEWWLTRTFKLTRACRSVYRTTLTVTEAGTWPGCVCERLWRSE